MELSVKKRVCVVQNSCLPCRHTMQKGDVVYSFDGRDYCSRECANIALTFNTWRSSKLNNTEIEC
jgi:hypothetical protein